MWCLDLGDTRTTRTSFILHVDKPMIIFIILIMDLDQMPLRSQPSQDFICTSRQS
jgi:hypothetical protein